MLHTLSLSFHYKNKQFKNPLFFCVRSLSLLDLDSLSRLTAHIRRSYIRTQLKNLFEFENYNFRILLLKFGKIYKKNPILYEKKDFLNKKKENTHKKINEPIELFLFV